MYMKEDEPTLIQFSKVYFFPLYLSLKDISENDYAVQVLNFVLLRGILGIDH